MNHELPVRPRPITNESVEGYLLRIATRNGWQQSGQLLNHIGLPAKYYVDSPDRLIKLCEKLAPLVRLAPEGLIEHFYDQLSHKWLYDEKRALQDLRVRFPRLCPLCVNQTGFHWHWSLATVSHCETHNHELWDHCPKCGEPFEWHSELFFGCPNCDYTWEAGPDSTIPAHQQQFRRLLANGIGLQDFIHDLTLALRAISRPYDTIYDNRCYWPTSQRNLSETITAAYELLTEPKALKDWINHCAYARSDLMPLGSESVLSPIITFQTKLRRDWPIKQVQVTELDNTQSQAITELGFVKEWIRPARLRVSSDNITIRFQANGKEVQKALGLPVGSIKPFIKTGALHPTKSSRIPRDQYFDLRDVANLMNKLPAWDEKEEAYLKLMHGDLVLKRHGIHYAEIVGASLVGEIKAMLPQGATDLSCLWLEEESLTAFCLEHVKANSRGANDSIDPAVTIYERFLDQNQLLGGS